MPDIPVPPCEDLHEGCWLLLQESQPGVYYDRASMAAQEDGGLAKAYQNWIDADRDFRMYRDSGMLELLNLPVVERERWVLLQGYEVGIYADVLSAFIIGLRWEVGDLYRFSSQDRAMEFFQRKLLAGEVRTKIEKVEIVRGRMFPVRTHTWVVETL
ncbi:hypothetical protein V5O48_009598 [Marasmius crinis-equi]|uniref:Uncharacterized protein n=1 Tax=Marasmius crinis-equi TaxID=585013 RepID=A0ABR3FAS5_9AGAR